MIAYDTNILIYAFEGTSEWAHAAQNVVQQGEHDGAVLSVLVWQELMTGAITRGDDFERLSPADRADRMVPSSSVASYRSVADSNVALAASSSVNKVAPVL